MILFRLIISFFDRTGNRRVEEESALDERRPSSRRSADAVPTFHGEELVRLLLPYEIDLPDISLPEQLDLLERTRSDFDLRTAKKEGSDEVSAPSFVLLPLIEVVLIQLTDLSLIEFELYVLLKVAFPGPSIPPPFVVAEDESPKFF